MAWSLGAPWSLGLDLGLGQDLGLGLGLLPGARTWAWAWGRPLTYSLAPPRRKHVTSYIFLLYWACAVAGLGVWGMGLGLIMS